MCKLKQQAIAEVMQDAGKKIAAIDRHTGLIAECEALVKQINTAAERNGSDIKSAACVCPHTNGTVSVWISINYARRSEIYAAIRAAGVEIAGETTCSFDSALVDLHLEGFDVRIVMGHIVEELAEAA